MSAVMPLPPTLYCGPSGWSYPHWNGYVYPRLKPRGFHPLEDIARYFDAVEINTTFYQPIRPEIAGLWLRKVSHNPNFCSPPSSARRFTHERGSARATWRSSRKVSGRFCGRASWAAC